MSKKNNLITTSAIISLLLSSVSPVYAEPNKDIPYETQLTEVEVKSENVTELSKVLNEEQKVTLSKMITEYNDILVEALKNHEDKNLN